MFEIQGKYNTAKIFTDNCDKETISQITELLNQSFIEGQKVRIMPDTHAGKGCVIGTTMTLSDKVVPNLVGVDIGCGMLTIKLAEKEIDLPKLDEIIRKYIPSGFDIHTEPKALKTRIDIESLKCYEKANLSIMRAYMSVGTLGGGNHFIEIDKDTEDNLYLVIHTGSRNLGKQVAEYYQDLGYQRLKADINEEKYEKEKKHLIEKLKAAGKSKLIGSELNKLKEKRCNDKPNIPYDLAYVEGQDFKDYIEDMKKVQMYASDNRAEIARLILKYANLTEVERFETIHNYIDTDAMILRKGAVSAMYGEKLLIPINMRDGSLICIGKGNPDWNCSAPHGAGRIMSRGKAKETVKLEDFIDSMTGIYTTSVGMGTLDESPFVYKPMDEILNNIENTVEVVNILKPIYNFKASEKAKELEQIPEQNKEDIDLD